jgi:hypothetical protein
VQRRPQFPAGLHEIGAHATWHLDRAADRRGHLLDGLQDHQQHGVGGHHAQQAVERQVLAVEGGAVQRGLHPDEASVQVG